MFSTDELLKTYSFCPVLLLLNLKLLMSEAVRASVHAATVVYSKTTVAFSHFSFIILRAEI